MTTWRCGHPRTPENTHGGTERTHAQCRTCRRATQRKADERYRDAHRSSIQARNRASYAAGGAAYLATMRKDARRTISRHGLDLDDDPRFKLLKDQRAAQQ